MTGGNENRIGFEMGSAMIPLALLPQTLAMKKSQLCAQYSESLAGCTRVRLLFFSPIHTQVPSSQPLLVLTRYCLCVMHVLWCCCNYGRTRAGKTSLS
eukprot:6206048-Pleurochrysis_carterae.AAC.4